VIAIGLLPAPWPEIQDPKRALCRDGILHGRQWRPLRSTGREGFSERAYAERVER
jgi:hypothetical protein